ncbi:GumC family protein [Primorskyibacter sp. S187A]|uniref:GumC family protein n=1 Tax=Primorskyibacter sp. S187A TaxID=3415130 RepID=UPI003C7DFFC7
MNLGLSEHITTIFRHWVKILLVISSAVTVAGAVAFLSSKVYVAETRVLILSRSPAARASSTNFTDEAQNASPQEQVLTQVEILKSPVLALQLAEELGPERVLDEMTWRWDWLRALPNKWKNEAVIALYEWDVTADFIAGSGIKKPSREPSPPSVGAAAGKIIRNLHADAILKTDMFGAAFASPDPKFSAEVMNALIELYTEHVIALGRPASTAQIAQLEASRLEQELRDVEDQLRTYSVENEIVSLERQKELLLDRLSRLQDELANAQRERLEAIERIAVIQNRISELPAEEAVSVTTVANPLLDRLSERLAQLQTELRQFVPGSPSANKLRIEIEGVEAQLASAATDVRGSETVGASSLYQNLLGSLSQQQADRVAKDVRVDFLETQLKNVDAELRRLDQLELRHTELARMVAAKEEAFRYALQKREETAIADQLADGRYLAQVVQVEPAYEPSRPAAPRRFRLLALGLIAGTFAGIGLAYLLEFSRRQMLTRREVEIALGLPVLATQQYSGFIRRRKRANRTEIRTFVSRLLHRVQPGGRHVLMCISDDRATGQTSVVGAIAEVMHQQDARVLKVRIELNAKTSDGVQVDVTNNDGTPVTDARGARNDTAVLKGVESRMQAALADLLRERGSFYDVILIDPPELHSFPEALFIASMVDDVLPVVEAGRTRVRGISEVIDEFREVGASVPGVIVTKLRHSRSSWAFCWMAMMRLRSADRAHDVMAEHVT